MTRIGRSLVWSRMSSCSTGIPQSFGEGFAKPTEADETLARSKHRRQRAVREVALDRRLADIVTFRRVGPAAVVERCQDHDAPRRCARQGAGSGSPASSGLVGLDLRQHD
jgi:hypothetical protein